MPKYQTLILLFGALVFASCSGGDKDADATSSDDDAVISNTEAASQAAEEITDDDSAAAALEELQKELDG